MTDAEFVRAVEEAAAGRARPHFRFGQREHLRLAWIALRRDGPRSGADRTAELLRRLAAAHGEPERYHETLTRFWLTLVAHVQERQGREGFDAALFRHPQLLDGRLVARHYSPETLWSERARRVFVEPDLEPLPGARS